MLFNDVGLSNDILFFFICLQITKADIKPQAKWAVNLVIADGHIIYLRSLCKYVWVNIFTLSPPRVLYMLHIIR